MPLDGGVELRDVAELGVTLLQHDVEGEGAELREVILQFFVDHCHGGGGVVLRAAARLAQNVVDAAEELDVTGGVFEERRRPAAFCWRPST